MWVCVYERNQDWFNLHKWTDWLKCDWKEKGKGRGALNTWLLYFWHTPDTSIDKTDTESEWHLQQTDSWDIHQLKLLCEKTDGSKHINRTNQCEMCSFGHVDSCLQAELWTDNLCRSDPRLFVVPGRFLLNPNLNLKSQLNTNIFFFWLPKIILEILLLSPFRNQELHLSLMFSGTNVLAFACSSP